ncbi:hypothetical protein [Streptomyces sp. NPDC046939]|uniref:hypothetical protein n=1 Tax=Streptomyces sp. NPDC046939 TaxID=3155376 RepID=UPI0033D66EDA
MRSHLSRTRTRTRTRGRGRGRIRTAAAALAVAALTTGGLAALPAVAADNSNPPAAADCSKTDQQVCTRLSTLDASDQWGAAIAVGGADKGGRVYAASYDSISGSKDTRLFEVNADENRELKGLSKEDMSVAMVDEATNTLYAGTTDGIVYSADLNSSDLTYQKAYAGDSQYGVRALALDGSKHLYVAQDDDVYKQTLGATSPPEKVATVGDTTSGIALDDAGQYLYVGTDVGRLYRQRMEKGYAPKKIADNLGDMSGMQKDGAGNLIYATDGGELFRFTPPAGGAQASPAVKLATGLGDVDYDIALDSQGTAYTINTAKQVYKVTGAGKSSGTPAPKPPSGKVQVEPGGKVTLTRGGKPGYPGVYLSAGKDGASGKHTVTVSLPQDKGLEFVGEPTYGLMVMGKDGTHSAEGSLSRDGQTLTFTDVDLGLSGEGAKVTALVLVKATEGAQTGDTSLDFRVDEQSGRSSTIHVTD